MRVAAFYRFVELDEAELAPLRRRLLEAGEAGSVTGIVLLATEGVNGTICGPRRGVEALLELLQADPRLGDLPVRVSRAPRPIFHRLRVRIKREIVSLGQPVARPAERVGRYVEPRHWDALIRDPDTLVIDTRNRFEVRVGTFPGALDPGTDRFRDFPTWVERVLRPRIHACRPRRLALFCTGGIRCEKATSYLLAQGFESVHHLQGGILRYLEEIPEAESAWRGECFVFDQRVALDHRLEAGCHTVCHGCRMPLSPADRAHPAYEEGVSCPHCLHRSSAADRQRFAERRRQVALALHRGQDHIGRRFDFLPSI